MDLVAIEEIKQLKYRYFRSLDLKDWDTFGDTLTADVRARYGTKAMASAVHYDTREEVVDFMATNLPPAVITTHVASHPEIDVEGDRATASWVFEDTVIATAPAGGAGVLIRGSGYYRDEYRREADGRWRISATTYERIYEVMTSMADTPSFTFLANRWDPDLAH
jgi:hypothetical protein